MNQKSIFLFPYVTYSVIKNAIIDRIEADIMFVLKIIILIISREVMEKKLRETSNKLTVVIILFE